MIVKFIFFLFFSFYIRIELIENKFIVFYLLDKNDVYNIDFYILNIYISYYMARGNSYFYNITFLFISILIIKILSISLNIYSLLIFFMVFYFYIVTNDSIMYNQIFYKYNFFVIFSNFIFTYYSLVMQSKYIYFLSFSLVFMITVFLIRKYVNEIIIYIYGIMIIISLSYIINFYLGTLFRYWLLNLYFINIMIVYSMDIYKNIVYLHNCSGPLGEMRAPR